MPYKDNGPYLSLSEFLFIFFIYLLKPELSVAKESKLLVNSTCYYAQPFVSGRRAAVAQR